MNDPVYNSVFLRSCRQEKTDRTPVWLMRQAGRYQPEYQQLRQKYGFLELCTNAELIAKVTLIPFHYTAFDAAIIFSDISIILKALGIDFSIEEKVGPVIKNPVKNLADLKKLKAHVCAESLGFLFEGIKLAKKELSVPLIGFAAGPFTLASYLIAGKMAKENAGARKLMYSDPEAWDLLMKILVDLTVEYLSEQVKAGADVIQVFDSWIGALHPDEYQKHMFPHMQRLFSELRPLNVPTIHFGTGTAMLLSQMSKAGGDIIGVDWRTPLDYAASVVGPKTLMGNLDPAALLCPWEHIQPQVESILTRGREAVSHIFNLGHGILPGTPVENVQRLVEYVQNWRSAPLGREL